MAEIFTCVANVLYNEQILHLKQQMQQLQEERKPIDMTRARLDAVVGTIKQKLKNINDQIMTYERIDDFIEYGMSHFDGMYIERIENVCAKHVADKFAPYIAHHIWTTMCAQLVFVKGLGYISAHLYDYDAICQALDLCVDSIPLRSVLVPKYVHIVNN